VGQLAALLVVLLVVVLATLLSLLVGLGGGVLLSRLPSLRRLATQRGREAALRVPAGAVAAGQADEHGVRILLEVRRRLALRHVRHEPLELGDVDRERGLLVLARLVELHRADEELPGLAGVRHGAAALGHLVGHDAVHVVQPRSLHVLLDGLLARARIALPGLAPGETHLPLLARLVDSRECGRGERHEVRLLDHGSRRAGESPQIDGLLPFGDEALDRRTDRAEHVGVVEETLPAVVATGANLVPAQIPLGQEGEPAGARQELEPHLLSREPLVAGLGLGLTQADGQEADPGVGIRPDTVGDVAVAPLEREQAHVVRARLEELDGLCLHLRAHRLVGEEARERAGVTTTVDDGGLGVARAPDLVDEIAEGAGTRHELEHRRERGGEGVEGGLGTHGGTPF